MRDGLAVMAALFLGACSTPPPSLPKVEAWVALPNQHALGFQVFALERSRLVMVFGQGGRSDTLAQFIIGDAPGPIQANGRKLSELDRIALISTTHLSYLAALGEMERVVAVAHLAHVRDPLAVDRIARGGITEIGTAEGLDRERLLATGARVVFDYPFGGSARATRAELTVVPVTEYLEEHPLGRAEWIRFFGTLLGKEHLADSLYRTIADRYELAARWAKDRPDHPTVFFGSNWEGQWHVPPGNSYMARLITDAGGKYCFTERRATGNIAVDLETVITEGRKADRFGVILANGGSVTTMAMVGGDDRLASLPAVSEGGFYLDSEASDIFGQALLEPDVLLEDLSCVLHGGKCSVRGSEYILRPVQYGMPNRR